VIPAPHPGRELGAIVDAATRAALPSGVLVPTLTVGTTIMTLRYGFVKSTVAAEARIHGRRRERETQYHLHTSLNVPDAGGSSVWQVAVNVGTDDADDLLRYRLVLDFRHPITRTLAAAEAGFNELTGSSALPALDFLRSDLLAETGKWRDSDIMDGSENGEPYRSLARLLREARQKGSPVYVFGRMFTDGAHGIHDIHMNQGSSGGFLHAEGDDHNDHNDVWQDGAVLVDRGDAGWAAYFTAFTQQKVPTDALGNPGRDAHEITDRDPGSEAAGGPALETPAQRPVKKPTAKKARKPAARKKAKKPAAPRRAPA
jgi:uncharacterized protein YukJ